MTYLNKKKMRRSPKVDEKESQMPYDHQPTFRSDQKEKTRERVNTLLTFLSPQLL